MSSICDNQVQPSSDESPYCTIPIRSWVSQTLVFLMCTILLRCHQVGFSSLTIKFRPTLKRIPEYHHFQEQLLIGLHNSRQNREPQWPGSIRRSDKLSVFLGGSGPLCELFVPPDWPFFWIGSSRWFGSVLKQFSRRVTQSLARSSSGGARRCEIIHWINHLHFFDPKHSFLRKLRTSTYLGLESYLPASKRGLCREFIKMKIWNLQSLLVCPTTLWRVSSTEDDRNFGWLSRLASLILILCLSLTLFTVDEWSGSSVLVLHGFNSCGKGAEEDATGLAETFPDIPCVSQMLGGPSLRLGIPKERLSIPSGIGWGGNDTSWLVTWECPLRTDSASWKSLGSFMQ